MTKISVIIPFYNVEKYFDECLRSVVFQTLSDIEILLINDFSTDASSEIAEKYALTDERIKIFKTDEHLGQGNARNIGIDNATGEYIGFVDSDDKIDACMFEKMYNAAKSADADITMCRSNLYDDKTGEVSTDDYYSLKPLEKFGSECFSPYDAKDEILNINVVLWNKIYKRELLNGIRFVPGYIYEDLPFFFETFLKAGKVNVVNEYLYTYRCNRAYSTMQNSDKKVYDRIPMVEKTYNILKNSGFFEEKRVEIIGWVIDDIFHRYTLLEDKYYENYYPMMKQFFQNMNVTDYEEEELRKTYCHDEFCAVVNSTYNGFWRFLIEKYKTSNKRIKAAEHKCNLDIIAIKEYAEKTKKETDEWWEKRFAEERQTILDNANKDCEARIEQQYQFLEAKKNAEMKHMYDDLDYKFNKNITIALKEQKEQLEYEFSAKWNEKEQYYISTLNEQRNYYETRFPAVKLALKFSRKMSQLKNKFERILKKR